MKASRVCVRFNRVCLLLSDHTIRVVVADHVLLRWLLLDDASHDAVAHVLHHLCLVHVVVVVVVAVQAVRTDRRVATSINAVASRFHGF